MPTSGSTFTVGTRTFRIDYGGGDGNDVVLTVVPNLTVATLVGKPVLNGGDDYVSSSAVTNQHSIVDRDRLLVRSAPVHLSVVRLHADPSIGKRRQPSAAPAFATYAPERSTSRPPTGPATTVWMT